jgi:superfamily I DNA/RNA helicase
MDIDTDWGFTIDLREEPAATGTLSPEQRAVADTIIYGKKDVAVIAAAGSGKTTTIAQAVLELINDHGEHEDHIVLLSFSRDAAEELRARLGPHHKCARTFHSLAVTTLRPQGCCVDDSYAEKRRIWQRVLNKAATEHATMNFTAKVDEGAEMFELRMDSDADTKMVRELSNLMTRMYAEGVRPHTAAAQTWLSAQGEDPGLSAYMQTYQNEVQKAGMWSYADIIADWHDRVGPSYRYVFVDEAQDMDPVLLSAARKLAGRGRLIAVGDLRQTIHVWKGANPDIFESFATAPETDRVYLNENRRSVPSIVDLANQVVRDHTYGRPFAVPRRNEEAGSGPTILRTSPMVKAFAYARQCPEGKQVAILARTWKALADFEVAAFQADIRYEMKQRRIKIHTIDRLTTRKVIEDDMKGTAWKGRAEWLARQDESMAVVCDRAKQFGSAREFQDWAHNFIEGAGPRPLFLGTAHSSKGKTIETVIVVTSNAWLEPKEARDIPAEERLLYVAFTRARNNLYICPSETGLLPRVFR